MVAIDLEPQRLERVKANLERLKPEASIVAGDARALDQWWDGQVFQRTLLDAPCSATGVIRRHPDIKLTRQADDIAALAQLQGELLDALWPTLAENGILLYATCSTLPTENTEVIAAFTTHSRCAKTAFPCRLWQSPAAWSATTLHARRSRWFLLCAPDQASSYPEHLRTSA